MTDQPQNSPSLNLFSSLYETFLKILTLTLIIPLPCSEMFVDNRHNANQNSNLGIIFNNTLNMTENELVITNINFREYQTLLDRFRRKTTSSVVPTANETLLYHDIFTEGNETSVKEFSDVNEDDNNDTEDNELWQMQNSSMLKLRVDDTTLTKIFHDFSSTVNKYRNETNGFNYSTQYIDQTIDNLINRNVPENVSLDNINNNKPLHLTFTSERFLPKVSNFEAPRPPNYIRESSKSELKRVVTILGLFELSVGDSPRADGLSELTAAKLAAKHVNKLAILPGYKLHLITNDTKCDPGVGVDRFFHALYTERESRMVMLLGTACSEVTESIAKIVPYWNIVQVSFGSTSPALSDRSEFPLFCRTVAPDSSHNPARIAFIRLLLDGVTVSRWLRDQGLLQVENDSWPKPLQKDDSDLLSTTLDTSLIHLQTSRRNSYYIGEMSDPLSLLTLDMREQFGWDTVTAFSQNEEVYSLAVNELVTQLEAANITCAASITFAETDFKEQLQQLKRLDTRIIIGSFSQDMIPKIFCEAFRLGMFGAEYAWLVAGTPPKIRGTAPCARAQLARALEGLVTVTAYRGIVGDLISLSGLTNEKFHREMEAAGVKVSQYAMQTYDAVWTIALALSKAEQQWYQQARAQQNQTAQNKIELWHFDYDRKDMAEEFLNQLANLSFLGISGPVSFNGADRIGTSAFYQIQGGKPRLVALYIDGRPMECVECARAQWAGGIPAARRVLVVRVDSVWAPARLAVAVLAAAGVALALSFLAFNLHYSKRRSIKLSSPRLTNMTIVGCVLVYTAVALLGVDNATLPTCIPFSAMCISRVYILSAGFSLAFGSMFAKTYRVHRIFISNRSGVCKTKLLQDTPLIFLVCALLLIDGMIVTLWAILDPMERHLRNLTIEISATDRSVTYQPQIEVCKSQNTAGWLCALYAYKGLLLIVGVYMAWETRNVKISALNDSKYIGISVYSVVITSASVVVIGTIISERATLAYITITSLILITTTSTLCLLFLPKIVAIRSNTEEDPVIQSLGLRLECKTRRFVTDETQELHFRIEIQNKVYKREVAALDKEIGRLEKLLSEPLESTRGSTASISLHRRTELNKVEEEDRRSDPDRRTPSISGGLPMLLLSVLPPVIPRASWPSADAFRGRNSVSFSSQPRLNYRKSQPAIDLYNLCLNRRDEQPGFLSRIKSFFGSRPSSRKASTTSIADPTGQSIAAALKMHVGMIAGLVPGNRKRSMVLSCNTLHVPHPELKLRRESYAKSGPIIRITDDEPSCSQFESEISLSSGTQKYIAEPETKVNFVLPEETHKKSMSHQNSCERIRGSPRFPHRISPTAVSLTTLDNRRKTSADSVFNISGRIFDEQRRYSHQNVAKQESKTKVILESRWKSTEDARPGPSSRD